MEPINGKPVEDAEKYSSVADARKPAGDAEKNQQCYRCKVA